MRLSRSLWVVVFVAVVAGVGYALLRQPESAVAVSAADIEASNHAVGALGRVQPGDGVVTLGARGLSGQPSIVGKLLVRERDAVRSGQVVAELDSAPQLQAAYELADAHVEVARRRLQQVEAGARPSEVAAQRAEIQRLNAELEHAQKDLRRQEWLLEQRSTAEAAVDQARVRVESLTQLQRQARERLVSMSEVRDVDVAVAKAQLSAAQREAARLRAEYDASLVRASLDGKVIRIHAWPGEEVGPVGVMDIANTEQMYVLAEVAEGDMARVHPGQRATISGYGLPTALTGTVERVGLQVVQNSVLKLDPAEFSDSRIVETRIRLDDGQRVADLINLRVNVVIETGKAPAAPPRERS